MNPLKEMKVTSPYGSRKAPIPGASTYHSGVDLKASFIDAFAIARGVVSVIQTANQGIGLYVCIDHGDFKTVYGHMDSLCVKVGQMVIAGERIGTTGNSGNSQAPHLHFEVRKGKFDVSKLWSKKGNYYLNAVDPIEFLKSYGMKNQKVESVKEKTAYEKECDTANTWAKDNKISSLERLNEPVSKQEVIVMLYRILGGK